MNKQSGIEQDKGNGLKPPSKTLIKIYGLLAILLVIIPEWLAEITLGIENNSKNTDLPEKDIAWNRKPELRLSIMSIKELRLLAKQLKIQGYSAENSDFLKRRILKKMKKKSILLKTRIKNLSQKILRIR